MRELSFRFLSKDNFIGSPVTRNALPYDSGWEGSPVSASRRCIDLDAEDWLFYKPGKGPELVRYRSLRNTAALSARLLDKDVLMSTRDSFRLGDRRRELSSVEIRDTL